MNTADQEYHNHEFLQLTVENQNRKGPYEYSGHSLMLTIGNQKENNHDGAATIFLQK